MSTPDEAVRASLAEHAAGVTASAPAAPMSVPGGVAASVDTDALLARLAALEAVQAAEVAAATPVPDTRPTVAGASSGLADALGKVHDRLVAIETHLGL